MLKIDFIIEVIYRLRNQMTIILYLTRENLIEQMSKLLEILRRIQFAIDARFDHIPWTRHTVRANARNAIRHGFQQSHRKALE